MTRKIRVLSLTASLLVILTVMGTVCAQAPVNYVGVSAGDSFKYNLSFLWSSTNSVEKAPSSLVASNQTDYYQVNIQTTATSTVILQTAWRFQNGTIVNGTEAVDVSTGTGSSILVYAANLSASGLLYPLATDLPWIINSTEIRSYTGGFRTVNHIAVNRTDVANQAYSYMSLYFDKQTGILIESTTVDVYSNLPNQTFTRQLTLQESNVWTIPEFTPIMILPLALAASALVLALKRKNLRLKV
jgi:hypothetical protein